jgi:hypothetical protein
VWINPAEADSPPIAHGGIVKIYNERGEVLGGAYVTKRPIPGVAYMGQGARWDPIIPAKLDRGGAILQELHRHGRERLPCRSGQGHRRRTGGLAGWRRDYPEALNRDYENATSVPLSGWLLARGRRYGRSVCDRHGPLL